ncbi:kinase-like domain-containing protein [Trametes polyzona]|nr:kinase-like domain-containing protein [Trametes polyzona]
MDSGLQARGLLANHAPHPQSKLLVKYKQQEELGTDLPGTGLDVLGDEIDHVSIQDVAHIQSYTRETKRVVAMKVMNLNPEDGLTYTVMREIYLMKELVGHANIVQLLDCDVYETGAAFVLELCPQDLLVYMKKRRAEARPLCKDVSTIQRFMRELFQGVAFCHEKGILHRDLKPENLLLDSHKTLKIADFGLARRIGYDKDAEHLSKDVVTLWYRAPEVICTKGDFAHYDASIDLWSCGCILAELMFGAPLFSGFNEQTLRDFFETGLPALGSITNFLRKYRPQFQNYCGRQAYDLFLALLHREGKGRPTAAKALTHPFVAQQSTASQRGPAQGDTLEALSLGLAAMTFK